MKNKIHPPRWADRFLEWYCRPELLEEIQGDIYELFHEKVNQDGNKAASRQFIWNVLRSFRISTVRSLRILSLINLMMVRNYTKIAFRNLIKHPLFSLTNILGLSVGVLCCTLIMLYVSHEKSYDQWNPNTSRLVRIITQGVVGGTEINAAVSGACIAPDAAQIIPDIENWCRFRSYGSTLLKVDGSADPNILVEEVLHVDSTFFQLFAVDLIAGDRITCLRNPNSVSISNHLAKRLFNDPSSAVGKTLVVQNDQRVNVTSIFEKIPNKTHFEADILFSLSGNSEIANEPPLWGASNNFYVYLLLRDGTDFQAFRHKFLHLSTEKVAETISTFVGITTEEFEASGQYLRFNTQQVEDIHLQSHLESELEAGGSIQYVRLFSLVALLVMLVACINFMNLTTARSNKRMEEIAIRKVLGSTKGQLIRQFLSEACLTTALAVVIALTIAFFALPWFSELTGRQLTMPWQDWSFWLYVGLGTGVVSLLAGAYPAFILSRFHPVEGIKQQISGLMGRVHFRNGLVVFQFAIASMLIIGTIFIYQQIEYIRSKNLGYDQSQVLVVRYAGALGDNLQAYKERMLQYSAVQSATVSGYLPIPSGRSNSTYSTSPEFRQDKLINMQNWIVDPEYAKTLGLKMHEGRFYDRKHTTDSLGIILNQAAVETLQFEEPLGKKIYRIKDHINVPQSPDDFDAHTIIGVVEDFHYENMRQPIGSLAMFLGQSNGNIAFKYEADATASIVDALETNWRQLAQGQPFSYEFMDEAFAQTYHAEERVGRIAMLFAMLAIIVSCLGLFALSTYIVEQRTKEIGIRKILGAGVWQLVSMLSTSFVRLVIIAFLLGVPLIWYAMSRWLENFAYHIPIQWWVFALAGAFTLILALLTVGIQSTRAAISNPVESLRLE